MVKVFLAGNGRTPWIDDDFNNFYRLESFYYITKKEIPHIKKYKDFLLDSGAFTYMTSQKNAKVNWDEYIERYAEFIKKNNVKHFMELDIDVIVGYEEVKKYRKKLETLTGRRCIPVWHKSRGKDDWLDIVKKYDYVAIGGIVTKEIKPKEYKFFHWLLKEARKHNTKVHALGFTNLKGLKEYPFYSVDSTSWLSGNRFGSVYKFNGQTMVKFDKKQGQRVLSKETGKNNFYEWVKFSKYMDVKNVNKEKKI